MIHTGNHKEGRSIYRSAYLCGHRWEESQIPKKHRRGLQDVTEWLFLCSQPMKRDDDIYYRVVSRTDKTLKYYTLQRV